MTSLSATTLLAGLVGGFESHNFTWLARSGSIVVGLGVVILSRAFVAGFELRETVLSADTGLDVYSAEHWASVGTEAPTWAVEQQRNRLAVGLLGPAITFVGTIVWGFGDLLNHFQ